MNEDVVRLMEEHVNVMLNAHPEMEGQFSVARVAMPHELMEPLQAFLKEPNFENLGGVISVCTAMHIIYQTQANIESLLNRAFSMMEETSDN